MRNSFVRSDGLKLLQDARSQRVVESVTLFAWQQSLYWHLGDC